MIRDRGVRNGVLVGLVSDTPDRNNSFESLVLGNVYARRDGAEINEGAELTVFHILRGQRGDRLRQVLQAFGPLFSRDQNLLKHRGFLSRDTGRQKRDERACNKGQEMTIFQRELL